MVHGTAKIKYPDTFLFTNFQGRLYWRCCCFIASLSWGWTTRWLGGRARDQIKDITGGCKLDLRERRAWVNILPDQLPVKKANGDNGSILNRNQTIMGQEKSWWNELSFEVAKSTSLNLIKRIVRRTQRGVFQAESHATFPRTVVNISCICFIFEATKEIR